MATDETEQRETREGVTIEEVSESQLRITVDGEPTNVSVERIYRTSRHFGEFRSLDHLIAVLKGQKEHG